MASPVDPEGVTLMDTAGALLKRVIVAAEPVSCCVI